MNVQPPPTQKEMIDLAEAFRHNIPESEFRPYRIWYYDWGSYLIGLRRSYQQRFLSEAYNEHPISPQQEGRG